MLTPCHDDLRFISDDPAEMREAAALCLACPVFDECWELRRGEIAGVTAGTLPNDPARVAARAAATKSECINGHPHADYGVTIPWANERPKMECLRCAALQLHISDPARPARMPETPATGDDILHGSSGGYRKHNRRGEPACSACLEARPYGSRTPESVA